MICDICICVDFDQFVIAVIIFFLFSTLMELVREIWLILKIKLRKRRKKWKVKKRYPFARIDKKIHSQAIKPNYETTNQIDGTSKDIMKYIIGNRRFIEHWSD